MAGSFIQENSDKLFQVKEIVPETAWYVCAPCGNKRAFRKGSRFTACLSCFKEEKRDFIKGLEVWEKLKNEN